VLPDVVRLVVEALFIIADVADNTLTDAEERLVVARYEVPDTVRLVVDASVRVVCPVTLRVPEEERLVVDAFASVVCPVTVNDPAVSAPVNDPVLP
jgi:hypothetical protein